MFNRLIIQDFIGALLLLAGCLISGLAVNEIRSTPLPLAYSSPEFRLNQIVKQMHPSASASPYLNGDISRDEIQKISLIHSALILDARPKVFYRFGHIPSALSLPRDDFERQYQVLYSHLQSHHDSLLVVYCSGMGCQDSQMVADALKKLAYPHVSLFRGGWSAWEAAGLPEEKK